MYEKSALSECELVTMRCVWNLGKNATAFNVINMLAEDYGMVYKETTVYTFLKKLKEKGFLDTFRKGVTYYVPKVEEETYQKEMAKKLLRCWYKGDVTQAVEAVVEGEKISRREARKIRDAVRSCCE